MRKAMTTCDQCPHLVIWKGNTKVQVSICRKSPLLLPIAASVNGQKRVIQPEECDERPEPRVD